MLVNKDAVFEQELYPKCALCSVAGKEVVGPPDHTTITIKEVCGSVEQIRIWVDPGE